jgi:NADPH:quinone reductase-like Zn-dependent oxidoreductase
MIETEAWVLHRAAQPAQCALDAGEFRRETYRFPDLDEDEILVEPLFGSWEANMSHAIARTPIDICRLRGEDQVVLGNCGVLRVLDPGPRRGELREGDVGVLFGPCRNSSDRFGYMTAAHGYDARRTIGLLAKRIKIPADVFTPLPQHGSNGFSQAQWAAYCVRYLTAWSNWRVAYGAYRLQVSEESDPSPHVWGWGGGATFAELDLARRMGCRAAMISGTDANLELIRRHGIVPIDRRRFPDLHFDEERYESDRAYRTAYKKSENAMLRIVREHTDDQGVAVFIDYIGTPVARATDRALAREGVVTTAGWKLGLLLQVNRALKCMHRNIHVHTHFASVQDWNDATAFSAKTGWMPTVTEIYQWDDVEALAKHAQAGTASYFPLFQVNPL